MAGPGSAGTPRVRGSGGWGWLPLAPHFVARGQRRMDPLRSCRTGRGGAGPPRSTAHPRAERRGCALCARLRACPGPALADGDEPARRRGSPRRGAGAGRPRHRPPAADSRAVPPGGVDSRAPRTGVAASHRGLRARSQRVAGGAGRSLAARVPDPRIRTCPLACGRQPRVAQGHGARSRPRVDPRPHASANVEGSAGGPHPRLLPALPGRQALGRGATACVSDRTRGHTSRLGGDGRGARRGRESGRQYDTC